MPVTQIKGTPILIYSCKDTPASQVVITKEVFTIGRGGDNDLQILDPQISRRHAEIQRTPQGEYLLRDRGSTSGTFVNNTRIGEYLLRPGDRFVLADLSVANLQFVVMPAEPVSQFDESTPTLRTGSGTLAGFGESSETIPTKRTEPFAPTSGQHPTVPLKSGMAPELAGLAGLSLPPGNPGEPSVEMKINDRQTKFLNLELLREQLKVASKPSTDQTLQRLTKLYEITHALLPAKSVREMGQKWLDALFSCLPVEKGAIMLYNPQTGELEQFMSRDTKGRPDPIEVSSTIVEQTYRENLATLSRDARNDERFASRQSVMIQNIRSVLSAPISSNLRVWGVCYLFNSRAVAQFNSEDLEFLMATAREAGLVLENLQLVGHLEAMVAERTAEVVAQRDEIQRINTHVMDSIRYAERIQQAILPTQQRVDQMIQDNFVLFRPKDIVSGDFYWFHEVNGVVIAAVADCTGHGVPGAFMSMIGNTLLNQIVIEKHILDPALILENLHNGVREALRQTQADSESQDGMDVCLCRIEPGQVTFAGAKRPLYCVPLNGSPLTLEEIKGDKRSVGGMQKEARRTFTNQTIAVGSGLMLYLTSDGFGDQPSPEGAKYGTRRLKELLSSFAHLPAREQFDTLVSELDRHQGTEVQRDDLSVIGIRVV
ncbi:MAG: FHA domain-containing protein [Blastocatellia bacterium]|nr:FHA domain-containing protein [Blastocatellia bacterium]